MFIDAKWWSTGTITKMTTFYYIWLFAFIRHSLSVCVTFSCWDDKCFSFQHKVFFNPIIILSNLPPINWVRKNDSSIQKWSIWYVQATVVGSSWKRPEKGRIQLLMSWKGRRYKQLEAVCWRVKVNKLILSIIPMGHII